jgi:GNAT superfamily N-acetyltransferase
MTDYAAVLRAYESAWGWEFGDNADLRILTGEYYCAEVIADADCTIVATDDDGKFLGLACLICKKLSDCRNDAVQFACRAVRNKAEELLKGMPDGKYVIEFANMLTSSNLVLETRMRDGETEWSAELLFLLCATEARGKGVGKALVKKAMKMLKRAGVKGNLMLKTDTHCGWQFYPKTGWKVAAAYEWPGGMDMTAMAFIKKID